MKKNNSSAKAEAQYANAPVAENANKVKKCCICGKEITGYGNNPYPVRLRGECCDDCNTEYVIRARWLIDVFSRHKENKRCLMEAHLIENHMHTKSYKWIKEYFDNYKNN